MTNGDDKLTRRYRELPADEPPAALDAAIRDAAHRAVAPKWRAQRWAVPVSLAAVLVLAVGVTLRMQQEQPGIETAPPENEYSMPSSAPEPPAQKSTLEARPPAESAPAAAAPSAKPSEPIANDKALAATEKQKLKKDNAVAREADHLRASRNDPAATAQAPAEEKRFADSAERNVASPMAAPAPATPPPPAAAPVAPPAPAALARDRQEGQAAPTLRMQAAPQAKTEAARAAGSMDQAAPARPATMQAPQAFKESAAKDPRERELERIATLRREGKHAEADEALARFRRENPDYRIPDAIWEQVKPR